MVSSAESFIDKMTQLHIGDKLRTARPEKCRQGQCTIRFFKDSKLCKFHIIACFYQEIPSLAKSALLTGYDCHLAAVPESGAGGRGCSRTLIVSSTKRVDPLFLEFFYIKKASESLRRYLQL